MSQRRDDLRAIYEREDLEELRNRIASGTLTVDAQPIAETVLKRRLASGESYSTNSTDDESIKATRRAKTVVTFFLVLILMGLARFVAHEIGVSKPNPVVPETSATLNRK